MFGGRSSLRNMRNTIDEEDRLEIVPILRYVSHREVVCLTPKWIIRPGQVQEKVYVRLTRFKHTDALDSFATVTYTRLPKINRMHPNEGVF